METGLQSQSLQDLQQVSFHFWSCQLTEASPKYSWDPENWAAGASASVGERPQRRPSNHGNGEDKAASKDDEKVPAANGSESGHKNGHSNGHSNGNRKPTEDDAEDNADEGVTDADYMQHVLRVNACILGPKATGVHLISVRTKGYKLSEPDACPIVCIDPDSQRTLPLGYEFVLDSQNEVAFELTEGTGPIWLTGLHQVRVHDANNHCDDAEGEGVEDETLDSDESMDAEEEAGSDSQDEEDEEEADEEEEEDDDDDEEIRPPPKRVARASKSERPVASPKQPQPRRKAPAKKTSPPSPPPVKALKSKAAASAANAVKSRAAPKKPKA